MLMMVSFVFVVIPVGLVPIIKRKKMKEFMFVVKNFQQRSVKQAFQKKKNSTVKFRLSAPLENYTYS